MLKEDLMKEKAIRFGRHLLVVGGIVVSGMICLILCIVWALTHMSSGKEVISPRGKGSIVVVHESVISDGKVTVYAREHLLGGLWLSEKQIGGPYATDGNIKMVDAVWSKDGTLAIVRGEVYHENLPQRWRIEMVSAYDFTHHTVIKGQAKIADVLKRRGGVGEIAVSHPYMI